MNTTVSAAPATPASYDPIFNLAARVLLAALFLVNGYLKLTGYSGTVGYMGKVGLPVPELMTILAIVIELGGGLLLVIGWRTRWVAWLLILFVVVATFTAHRFWSVEAALWFGEMNNFLKNAAIIGGLLLVATYGPGPLSVEKR